MAHQSSRRHCGSKADSSFANVWQRQSATREQEGLHRVEVPITELQSQQPSMRVSCCWWVP